MGQKFKNWLDAPLTYRRLFKASLVSLLVCAGELIGVWLWAYEANKEAKLIEDEEAELEELNKLVNGKENEP